MTWRRSWQPGRTSWPCRAACSGPVRRNSCVSLSPMCRPNPCRRSVDAWSRAQHRDRDMTQRLTIRVGGLHTIDADLPAFRPTHLIGILDPTMPEPDGYRHIGPDTDRILLRYVDREVEREFSPLPEHVETSLAAIERAIAAVNQGPVRLFVHCHAGASRSTATAYLALARQYGPAEAEAAFAELLQITNKPWPNRRVVEFGDALLGGHGRLLKPLDAYRE